MASRKAIEKIRLHAARSLLYAAQTDQDKETVCDLKKIFNPKHWSTIKSPTFKSFMISLASLDMNSDFKIQTKEMETPEALKMTHLFRKRAVALVTNLMLVSSLMFIVTINVVTAQSSFSMVPFGKYDPDVDHPPLRDHENYPYASTGPHSNIIGQNGWITEWYAGSIQMVRVVSATSAMMMAMISIVIGVAYTATLTTWLNSPIDVVHWNIKYNLSAPVYPQVLACWFVVLCIECTIILSYPALFGLVCIAIITVSWVTINYYLFGVYYGYYTQSLDFKAAQIWKEISAFLNGQDTPLDEL